MIKLERLASLYFHKFAKDQNSTAEWKHLSDERKLVWQKEIANYFLMLIEEVSKDLALNLGSNTAIASFEKGFLDGRSFEHKRIVEKLSAVKKDLEEQLEEM